MKTVDVLGIKYKIIISNTKKHPHLSQCDGYCDTSTKECVINDGTNYDEMSKKKNFKQYQNETIRHELVHAFVHESGLYGLSQDEATTEWIAIQFPKLLKAFQNVECM